MNTKPPPPWGDFECSSSFPLSLSILSGTAIKSKDLTQANNPRLPSKRQVAVCYSLTLTKNPAVEASPPLPLSLLSLNSPFPATILGYFFVRSVLKISDSEEKRLGFAVTLKRKFLLSQQVPRVTTANTFLCSRIKDNYLLGRRGPKDEAQLTLSQPFRTSLQPRATFPATRRRREDTDKSRPQAACAQK